MKLTYLLLSMKQSIFLKSKGKLKKHTSKVKISTFEIITLQRLTNSICFKLNVFNFFEYLIQRFGWWEFLQCFLGGEFPNRFKQSIKANMRKESGRNTPSRPTVFLCFFKLLFDSIRVDDFVVTASNIATSEPFELFTSLKEKASFRNSY